LNIDGIGVAMRRNKAVYATLILLVIMLNGCGSDPEGPVIERFRDSTYTPEAGETFYYVETLQHSSIHLSTNVGGYCSLLKLGWYKGLKFETLLIDFDFDSLENYIGKTVSEVILDFPVRIYPGNFDLKIGIYELLEPFSEDDTLSSATTPAWAGTQIPDSLGSVPERVISSVSRKYSIDPDIVQNWIDGIENPWEYGLAVILEEDPDSSGFYEINSAGLEEGPITLSVEFEGDTTKAFFGVKSDYSLVSYDDNNELALLGGVATRIYFEFDFTGVSDSAIVHNSELVLNVDGSKGMGATAGEQASDLLGLPTDFYYYLYSPNAVDTLDPSFWEGIGVDEGKFYPVVTSELRFPLRRYTEDIIDGSRINNGLVLQSDLENVRFQKTLFYSGTVDSLNPRIEIIYSMPADFDGE